MVKQCLEFPFMSIIIILLIKVYHLIPEYPIE